MIIKKKKKERPEAQALDLIHLTTTSYSASFRNVFPRAFFESAYSAKDVSFSSLSYFVVEFFLTSYRKITYYILNLYL